MTNVKSEIVLQLGSRDRDAERLTTAASNLREELREFPVDARALREGHIPAGAKSADVAAIGALAVTLAPAVLPHVVEFLKAWLKRNEGHSVRIRAAGVEVEVNEHLSPAAIESLVGKITTARAER